MRWQRTALDGSPPDDPVGDAVAEALSDLVGGASVELAYRPAGRPVDLPSAGPGRAVADGAGPPGWDIAVIVSLSERVAAISRADEQSPLGELLDRLPSAGLRAAARLRRGSGWDHESTPPLQRALRDIVATELLAEYLRARIGPGPHLETVSETIDYLVELSGTRVEAHDLTHGVVIADLFDDRPRLEFRYPRDVRTAKRAPLLFDGQRAVLLVDPDGRARTELHGHRLHVLAPDVELASTDADCFLPSGSLVADATKAIGGLGFFLRADRSIWTFVDGQPLIVRRAEHWTAFPVELSVSIANMIGGGQVATLVAQAAFIVSAQPRGAILAIVERAEQLGDVVSTKDRFDLRDEVPASEMRTETRLHHLIDVSSLDEHPRPAGHARRRHRARPRGAARRLRGGGHLVRQRARGRSHGGGPDAVEDGRGGAEDLRRRRHHDLPPRPGGHDPPRPAVLRERRLRLPSP